MKVCEDFAEDSSKNMNLIRFHFGFCSKFFRIEALSDFPLEAKGLELSEQLQRQMCQQESHAFKMHASVCQYDINSFSGFEDNLCNFVISLVKSNDYKGVIFGCVLRCPTCPCEL